MGRPSKCTTELTQAIAADVAEGVPGEVAAEAHGLGRSTFYCWLKWGAEDESGFIEFRDAIKKARAVAETHYVDIVRRAAGKTWQAAAWWLERKSPKRWGRWGPSPALQRIKPHDSTRMTEEELLEKLKRGVVQVEEMIAQKQAANAAARGEP